MARIADEAIMERLRTFLDEDARIDGHLTCKGGLKIDGVINGNVETDDLVWVVGKVSGTVTASEIILSGEIGDGAKANRIELREDSRINGEIRYGRLHFEEGAIVNGRFIHMESDQ